AIGAAATVDGRCSMHGPWWPRFWWALSARGAQARQLRTTTAARARVAAGLKPAEAAAPAGAPARAAPPAPAGGEGAPAARRRRAAAAQAARWERTRWRPAATTPMGPL